MQAKFAAGSCPHEWRWPMRTLDWIQDQLAFFLVVSFRDSLGICQSWLSSTANFSLSSTLWPNWHCISEEKQFLTIVKHKIEKKKQLLSLLILWSGEERKCYWQRYTQLHHSLNTMPHVQEALLTLWTSWQSEDYISISIYMLITFKTGFLELGTEVL